MNDSRIDPELKQAVQKELTKAFAADASQGAKLSKQPPSGFARIAKQISSRATDLLAISIIAVAGLTMGGYLVDWWSTDPEQAASTTSLAQSIAGTGSAWGSHGAAVGLQFGDKHYSVARQVVRGDLGHAVGILKQNCLAIVSDQSVFSDSLSETTAAERRLLEASSKIEPFEQQLGKWQLFQIDKPISMIVGTQSGDSNHVEPSKPLDRPDVRRVVCWGLAIPSGRDLWTLFTYRATPRSLASTSNREICGSTRSMFSSGSNWLCQRSMLASMDPP